MKNPHSFFRKPQKQKSVKNNTLIFPKGQNYVDVELSDAEIKKYKDGGYVVQELNKMAEGGSTPCPKGYIFDPNFNKCVPEEVYLKWNPQISTKDKYKHIEENKKYAEAYDFMKDYYNSPKYKEMLKNSSKNNEAYNFILKSRNKQLENTPPFQILPQPEDQPNTGGYSMNDTGQIVMLPMGFGTKGTASHELSHSSDRPLASNPYRRLIPLKDIDFINQNKAKGLKDSREYHNYKWYYNDPTMTDFKTEDEEFKDFYTNYVGEPTEVRARLNAIRQGAKQNNLYDPFKEGVTPETYYKKLKTFKFETDGKENFDPMRQLQNTFSDKQIIWMLNNISKNTENKTDNLDLQYTKYGGSVVKELTPKEIDWYKSKGFTVEEID
jgi:hypothetical protein